MTGFARLVDVGDLRAGAGPNGHFRRVAGLMADEETLIVATMTSGAAEASEEFRFTLTDANRLAEACLAGDQRALTTPGLARQLSAFAAVLFRVCHAAGAFQTIEVFHEHGGRADDLGHQQEAGGDEGDGA